MTGWSDENTAGSAGEGAVTLLQGTSFCISFANGDMNPERPHGFFYRDTRFISDWSLAVNGRPVDVAALAEGVRRWRCGEGPRRGAAAR